MTASADVALLFFALDDFMDPTAALREIFASSGPEDSY